MKRHIWFITGSDTGAGKTTLAALMTAFLRNQGVRAAALKPVCSGDRADVRLAHAASGGSLTLEEINPWLFATPLAPLLAARLEKKELHLAQVSARVRKMARRFDVTLVEGAGGLLSPLGEGFNSRDLMCALNATPVVVVPNRLGAVSQALLVLEALPKRMRPCAQVVLTNGAKPDRAAQSNPDLLGDFFDSTRIHVLPWLGHRWKLPRALKQPGVLLALNKLVHSVQIS